jgi:hypothetical protein
MKSRFIVKCVFLVSLLCFSSLSLSAQNVFEFEGHAYDIDNQDLLYVEHHTVYLDGEGNYLSQQVEYKDPKGVLLVLKTLEYGNRAFLPSMSFQDKRNNHGFEATAAAEHVFLERDSGSSLDRFEVELSSSMTPVLDAGFDRLLAKNWDALRSGEVLEFDFFAPTRASMIGFRLSEMASDDKTSARFKIEPSTWLIRLLVDPIILDYDAESRRLVRYKGITNIPRSEGNLVLDENYRAEIVYKYIGTI